MANHDPYIINSIKTKLVSELTQKIDNLETSIHVLFPDNGIFTIEDITEAVKSLAADLAGIQGINIEKERSYGGGGLNFYTGLNATISLQPEISTKLVPYVKQYINELKTNFSLGKYSGHIYISPKNYQENMYITKASRLLSNFRIDGFKLRFEKALGGGGVKDWIGFTYDASNVDQDIVLKKLESRVNNLCNDAPEQAKAITELIQKINNAANIKPDIQMEKPLQTNGWWMDIQ